MTSGMRWIAGLAAASVVWAAEGVAAHPDHDDPNAQVFNVGKNGEVKIDDVTVGAIQVKKGKYLFEHRVDAERHIIVLTGLGKDAERTYEIPMRVYASTEVPKRSALIAKETKNHTLEVTVIDVAGEAGDHLPERVAAATAAQ